mgnify:FL=1
MLAEQLAITDRWQVEVAAMVSQIGAVTLAPHTLNKVYFGKPLTVEESAQVAEVPAVLDGLLAHIPRLEPVRDILAWVNKLPSAGKRQVGEQEFATIQTGAKMLRIALDFDTLETKGLSPDDALADMQARPADYEPGMLDAFIVVQKAHREKNQIKEIPLPEIQKGMVLAEDVKSPTGAVLIPRGFTVTPSLALTIQKFSVKLARITVKVVVTQ